MLSNCVVKCAITLVDPLFLLRFGQRQVQRRPNMFQVRVLVLHGRLGTGLSHDAYHQSKVARALKGRDTLPHHYVILASPADAEKQRTIDQRLAGAHITPLWYPDGEHEYVEQILELLVD